MTWGKVIAIIVALWILLAMLGNVLKSPSPSGYIIEPESTSEPFGDCQVNC